MKKSEVLEKIRTHFNFKSQRAFAIYLGKAASTINSWYSRETYDANLLAEKFPTINPVWLLTDGEAGEMIKKEYDQATEEENNNQVVGEEKMTFYIDVNILKSLRENKGMKRIEVAEAIGVSEKTIYNYEEDISKLKYNEIKKLADLFKVTPLDFYHNYKQAKELNLIEVKKEMKENNKINNELSDKLENTNKILSQFLKTFDSKYNVSDNFSEEIKEYYEAISAVISLAALDLHSIKDIQEEQLNIFKKINKI